MNASIVCIKTTNKALLLLTKCQPRNGCSPDSNDRIKEACFRAITFIYLPTHRTTLCNTQTTVPKIFPLPSHHGDPSEGRRTLAHGREVVEKRRGAVRLTKRLHLLDGFGHRLKESLQNCLKRKETTPSFTHLVDFSKFYIQETFFPSNW